MMKFLTQESKLRIGNTDVDMTDIMLKYENGTIMTGKIYCYEACSFTFFYEKHNKKKF
jgi:hypothetical protein